MNVRTFRDEVYRIKSKLSDKEVFLSEGFRHVCSNIVTGVSKAWNTHVRIKLGWENPDGPVAYATAENEVYLNLNNCFVQKMSRIDKYKIYIALLLHECGHRLFTNFAEMNRIHKRIVNNKYLSMENTEETNAFLSRNPNMAGQVASLVHKISNVIEDGFIELILLNKFPGYGKYLSILRDIQLDEAESLEEMRRKNLSTHVCIFNLLLVYAKYSTVKVEDKNSQDEALLAIENIKDSVDLARKEKNSLIRIQLCLEVFNQLLSHLLNEPEEQEESEESDNDSDDNNSSGSSSGSSASDEDDEDSEEDEENSQSSGASDDEDDKDAEEEENGQSSDSDDEGDDEQENGQNSSNSSSGDGEESDEEQSSFGSDSSNEEDDDQENSSGSSSGLTDEEINDILNQLCDGDDEEDGNAFGAGNNSEGLANQSTSMQGKVDDSSFSSAGDLVSNSNSEVDENQLEELEKDVAEEMVEKQAEEEIRKELNTLKDNMDYGEFHKKVTSIVTRASASPTSDFEKLDSEVSTVLRRLISEFKKKIRDLQRGDLDTGLYSGDRLYQPHRIDLKRFSKNKAPENIPDMSFILLVDESGSMSGKREQAARKAALLLYRFCREMNIRCSVYGHSAYFSKVNLVCYASFDSVDNKDIFRLSNVHAKNACNRDGYALRFCSELLAKEHSDQKILMIISDGAPNDDNYGYRYSPAGGYGNAKDDIQSCLRQYYRKGISYITAGIGDEMDVKAIKDIYTEGLSSKIAAEYLDVGNLEELPKTLVNILKRKIKV